jgi:hypothetical protein
MHNLLAWLHAVLIERVIGWIGIAVTVAGIVSFFSPRVAQWLNTNHIPKELIIVLGVALILCASFAAWNLERTRLTEQDNEVYFALQIPRFEVLKDGHVLRIWFAFTNTSERVAESVEFLRTGRFGQAATRHTSGGAVGTLSPRQTNSGYLDMMVGINGWVLWDHIRENTVPIGITRYIEYSTKALKTRFNQPFSASFNHDIQEFVCHVNRAEYAPNASWLNRILNFAAAVEGS